VPLSRFGDLKSGCGVCKNVGLACGRMPAKAQHKGKRSSNSQIFHFNLPGLWFFKFSGG
jgi:hypothetical protein